MPRAKGIVVGFWIVTALFFWLRLQAVPANG